MENILEVKNISKAYSKFALNNISFSLPRGTIMGLVGENGSGKTTTLSIVLGLLRQTSGTVNLFGNPYSINDLEMKAKIGVVFDGCYFPDAFRPADISKVFGSIYKRWDNAYFLDMLQKYEIDINTKISKLSHGTKALLAIITALSQRPELLILDEPTNGIDPVRREEVLDLFHDFVQDGTRSILFSSHITSDLEKIADYITIIHKGEVLDSADKDSFIYKYGIIRCNQDSFDEIKTRYTQQIQCFVKRDYQYRILIRDQSAIQQGDFVMENPTLDETMYLLTRGETL